MDYKTFAKKRRAELIAYKRIEARRQIHRLIATTVAIAAVSLLILETLKGIFS